MAHIVYVHQENGNSSYKCLYLKGRKPRYMEAKGSNETVVTLYLTTCHHTPHDSNIHIQCHENHKPHLINLKS